jgi:hypothetical protein
LWQPLIVEVSSPFHTDRAKSAAVGLIALQWLLMDAMEGKEGDEMNGAMRT